MFSEMEDETRNENNEKIKNIITLIALLSCVVTIILTVMVVRQYSTLKYENYLLTSEVNNLKNRLTDADNTYSKAINDKLEATTRVYELNKKMKHIKMRLTSAKKMLGLYTQLEDKAIATYITSKYENISPKLAENIAVNIIKVSKEEKVPISVLVAIIDKESGFNPTAISSKGARGLMQVMPFWARKLKFVKNTTQLHDIYKGIKAGAWIFRRALDKSNGNIKKAIALYNGGSDSVAYVIHVLKFIADYEIHREAVMRAVKSVLHNYYTRNEPKSDLS